MGEGGNQMGGLSIWHWLIVLIFFIVPLFPITRIFKKAGFSPWWAVLYWVPLINFIGLFVFAYTRWPAERDMRN